MEQHAALRLIEDTFNQPFAEERFRWFVVNLLNDVDERKAFNWVTGAYIRDSFKDHVKKYRRLGTYTDPDGQKIDILIVHLKKPWALDRARTTQRNFVATYLKQRGEKDAALVAYHTDDPTNWRFSFVRMEYREEVTPTGKVHVKEEFTPARRYSFLVGQNEPSHTAQAQLLPILEDDGRPTIDTIEQAFSVEAVTKQFYLHYRGLFESVRDAIAKLVETDPRVRGEFEVKSIDPANFAKKLLGQIVFLYFLQKKGWLGVGKDDQGNLKPWGSGPKDFLQRLFNRKFVDYDNFFNDVLEPLFYEALATERPDDYYSRFNCKIPFLNGGLFEAIHDYNWREIDILLPNELFQQIFDIFDLYNFTVREDEPLEKEVAVDPEMLGKVFENLLPENLRKGKGTYYTPRPIVHYMCQESLINYLAGESEGIIPKEDIEELVRRGEFAVEHDRAKQEGTKTYKYKLPESIRAHAKLLDDKLAEIKVCDPAVGSGAFPVGMMHEIVKARNVLTNYLPDKTGRDTYSLKRHCIQESLYGVDIDPGAIDIAKLRLWLSLIVDEEDYERINPLPNLDYKIMQGNSLIEEFHGISLDLGKSDNGDLLGKDPELERLIKNLHEKQNAFFNATHPGEKRRLKDAVEEAILAVFRYRLKQEKKPYYDSLKSIERTASTLPENLRAYYLQEETAKLNKRFDFDPEAVERELREMTHGNKVRNFFPWRLYFADVFRNKGGFDVVIANPPYIDSENMTRTDPHLRRLIQATYSLTRGNWDIYIAFYEKGFELLGKEGVLSFITPDKWISKPFGDELRTRKTDNIFSILRAGRDIFENVNVDAIVSVFTKTEQPFLHINEYVGTKICPKRTIRKNTMKPPYTYDWLFTDFMELVAKIDTHAETLSKYAFCENACATSDAYKLKPFIKERPANAEIDQYLRVINTGTIAKYVSKWGHREMVYLGSRYTHPVVNKKLFQEAFRNSYGRKAVKPKLIMKGLNSLHACLDADGRVIPGKTTLLIACDDVETLKLLLAILNSTMVSFYLTEKYPASSYNQGITFTKQMINNLPLPELDPKDRGRLVEVVDQILAAKRRDYGANTTALEREIDHLVYDLYGLTPEEIKIVEEKTR